MPCSCVSCTRCAAWVYDFSLLQTGVHNACADQPCNRTLIRRTDISEHVCTSFFSFENCSDRSSLTDSQSLCTSRTAFMPQHSYSKTNSSVLTTTLTIHSIWCIDTSPWRLHSQQVPRFSRTGLRCVPRSRSNHSFRSLIPTITSSSSTRRRSVTRRAEPSNHWH